MFQWFQVAPCKRGTQKHVDVARRSWWKPAQQTVKPQSEMMKISNMINSVCSPSLFVSGSVQLNSSSAVIKEVAAIVQHWRGSTAAASEATGERWRKGRIVSLHILLVLTCSASPCASSQTGELPMTEFLNFLLDAADSNIILMPLSNNRCWSTVHHHRGETDHHILSLTPVNLTSRCMSAGRGAVLLNYLSHQDAMLTLYFKPG